MSFPLTAPGGRRVMELLGQSWGESMGLRTIASRLTQLVRDSNVEESAANEDTTHCPIGSRRPLPWGDIPGDVSLKVLGYLTARDLCSVRAASSGLLASADLHAERLWNALCRLDFPFVKEDQDGRSSHQVMMLFEGVCVECILIPRHLDFPLMTGGYDRRFITSQAACPLPFLRVSRGTCSPRYFL